MPSEKKADREVQWVEKAAQLQLSLDADKTSKSKLKGFNFSVYAVSRSD